MIELTEAGITVAIISVAVTLFTFTINKIMINQDKMEHIQKRTKEINKNMNLKLETEYFDNPYSFYQEFTQADITRTKQWGYIPEFDLAKGIKDYVDWIKSQESKKE